MIPEAELKALVGHRFDGGEYRIEHWENFLFTEATGSVPLEDRLAHPALMFHVPINGVGSSIAELFGLGRADSDASVTIDYYDWEYARPLQEDELYTLSGGVTEHARKTLDGGAYLDSLTFCIEMLDANGVFAARATLRWHFWRFSS